MDNSRFWWQAAGVDPGPIDPGDPIGQSLRFRSRSGTLSRTGMSGGSNVYTVSFWIKHGNASTNIGFGVGSDTGDFEDVFNVVPVDAIQGINSPQVFGLGLQSGKVGFADHFRDYSAWYHYHYTYDVNKSGADRVHVFVNGVELFNRTHDTTVTFSKFFQGADMAIGNTWYADADCYSTGIYVIDGQALPPETFGRFNSNGVWVPVDPKLTGGYSNVFFNGLVSSDPNIGVASGTPDLIFKEFAGGQAWRVKGNGVDPNVIRVNLTQPIDDATNIKFHAGGYNANEWWKLKVDGVEVGSGSTSAYWAAEENVTFSSRTVNYIEIEAHPTGAALAGLKVNDVLLGDPDQYGANGFHLTFADPTDLGKDYSGNGNHFTATGFETADQDSPLYDIMQDSPAQNFATINPLYPGASTSNANLTTANATGKPTILGLPGNGWDGTEAGWTTTGDVDFGQRTAADEISTRTMPAANLPDTITGTFTGNSNANGPFVYTGCIPARIQYGTIDVKYQDRFGQTNVDFLSNGFKIRSTTSNSGTVSYTVTTTHDGGEYDGFKVPFQSPAPAVSN